MTEKLFDMYLNYCQVYMLEPIFSNCTFFMYCFIVRLYFLKFRIKSHPLDTRNNKDCTRLIRTSKSTEKGIQLLLLRSTVIQIMMMKRLLSYITEWSVQLVFIFIDKIIVIIISERKNKT